MRNNQNSFGKTYGEHREYLEFNTNVHQKLLEHCKKKKIKYSCSAWDVKSAKDISKICKQYIKVPSATNLNFELFSILVAQNRYSESDGSSIRKILKKSVLLSELSKS